MRVFVNGTERSLERSRTVKELLEELGIELWGVAVVRDGVPLAASDYESTGLDEGDSVEVVRIVGGG